MLVAVGINHYSTGRDVTIGNVFPHILEEDRLHRTTTDPWSIGDIGILDNNQLANGPGIRLQEFQSVRNGAHNLKLCASFFRVGPPGKFQASKLSSKKN